MLQRLLKPVVDVRESESAGVLLMFVYSFLVMTAWNILKPITRSKFISSLGADQLPWVLLAAGVLIGFIMQGYSKAIARLPRRLVIPIAQAVIVALLAVFWVLFQSGATWVPVAFYFFGLIISVLLISQFWTLANEIYDPRQAKRLFGFIGGGASLGGMMGSAILQFFTLKVGTTNLLLVSAALLAVCIVVVSAILRRTKVELAGITQTGEEKGVSGSEAIKMLRESKHLQVIAMVIGFAAIGAAIIEQQLNMATEAFKGPGNTDNITQFLGQVQFYLSAAGFVIQVWLTSRIHRLLGIGFALLILPISLGSTAVVMLLNAALWSPALARIFDTSLRYTVDKTTREILFLPLPSELKQQAKPFVDVTMDRLSKGIGALIILVLISDWGLKFTWQQMSYASLIITGLWIFAAQRAKKGYLAAFRKSIERHDVAPAQVRIQAADLSTIETLIGELAHPDERRVLYAIDILESIEKRNLVTPLLLYHESPRVRARALRAFSEATPEVARSWQPQVERMLGDGDAEVRLAALGALASLREEKLATLVGPYVESPDPRIASAAAVALARTGDEAEVARAEHALAKLASDSAEVAAVGRREVALAVRQIGDARFHHLLVPLLTDSDPLVAEEAMTTVRQVGSANSIFVPTLVSLLRNRRLKSAAREVLVSYGDDVVDALAYFLNDPDEDIWVRRHIPATLARIPGQKSMDVLSAAFATEKDGFLRFKLTGAMERMHRADPTLTFDPKPVEARALVEARRTLECFSLHHNLVEKGGLAPDTLLARALREKGERATNRVWVLLGLTYPWKDVGAARWAIERGDSKAKSSALEYLDNLLTGQVRKRVLPVFEDMPRDERVRKVNVQLGTRERNLEETLLELINDEDEVVAAAAVQQVAARKVWTLAGDLEHVLEHRDVRDFYVFEATSWALAEHRMPAERRRALWLEPLPAVEVAARLSALPLFSRTSVDELFRMAQAGRQARYETGRVIGQEGAQADTLQFLLDGRVVSVVDGQPPVDVTAPASLAFEELLQGLPLSSTTRTADTTVCLALTLDEVRTLLSDSTDLVQGLFSTILERPAFASRRLVLAGAAGPELASLASEGVSPVERALALQRVEFFARVPTSELLRLADVARPVSMPAGKVLFANADTPSIWFVLNGELSLEEDGAEPVVVAAGDTVGLYETLAGSSLGRTGRVTRDVAALHISYDDLFDLLGQQPDLLRHLFGALLGTGSQPVG